MDFASVYVTCPSAEVARAIARRLLDARLVACANVLAAQSVYRWEGAIVDEPEVVMFLKTRRALVDEVVAAVKAAHPYQVPCVVALPIVAGHAPYLEWIASETKDSSRVPSSL